nr:putative late blight resistance protein homolog R1B-14 [Ipomoea batatas]
MPFDDCRWINCISSHWPTSNRIHSILYYGQDVELARSMLVFSGLKLLRVLDLSLIKCWYGLPSEIEEMVHLRYLALSAFGSLGNYKLNKLRNLQILIVCSWEKGCCLQLPRDILQLPWLRHVHLDERSSVYLPKLVQKNLQTLLWLKVNGQDPTTTDFTTVPKLKKLWVLIDNELPSNAFDSLVHLDSLQKLKLKVESVCFNFPTDLPKHLKRLTLSGTFLPWVDMYNIERLPNLEVLKLTKFACSGPEWKLEDGSKFGCLKLLLIADSDLEYWEATHVNFPVLERLILKVCWDLKEIPSDFENISTLKLIQLDNCYSSLVESAKKIQEDIEMYGDTLVIRDLETKVQEEFKIAEVLQCRTKPQLDLSFVCFSSAVLECSDSPVTDIHCDCYLCYYVYCNYSLMFMSKILYIQN